MLKKLKPTLLLLLLLCLLGPRHAGAQVGWNQFYDYSRRIHFGFTIGTNVSTFKYRYAPEWYAQDTIKAVRVQKLPGITLGAVADLHLGEHFDLRLIPSLVLSQRNILYDDSNFTDVKKEVESAFIEAPLLLKFKSVRHRNTRFYVIGGAKYSYDLSSDAEAKRNPADPAVVVRPHNFYYEYGCGLDMYFQYFKFSPEIKLSRGINNVLVPDPAIYSRVFSGFRSQFVFFSLYFEG